MIIIQFIEFIDYSGKLLVAAKRQAQYQKFTQKEEHVSI